MDPGTIIDMDVQRPFPSSVFDPPVVIAILTQQTKGRAYEREYRRGFVWPIVFIQTKIKNHCLITLNSFCVFICRSRTILHVRRDM